ncbi:MAG: hypothetical protein E7A67_01085 [Peptostreptococcus anaerobius]|jgi:hypothetical protein|uniref:hypothetical protein n=1 Tax=Peptostreptococcus anaerobius TaxID=1261 RepID=UPI002903DD6D|nr:hypothetical protein [Peptostreptococcus anaerobius]MDU0963590.1 hypothetical protein [Peptostreptococcus anaerobius]MDU0997478.1 hypothetical protein [Peptostreptococcus anaerobius]
MDVVKEYLKNLKRFDDADRYFKSLSDEQIKDIESTKEYAAFKKIWFNLERLYPLAKAAGCNRIKYYGG